MQNTILDSLVNRSIDSKLSFEVVYYLIMGDYPDDKAISVLMLFVDEKRISTETLETLIILKNKGL